MGRMHDYVINLDGIHNAREVRDYAVRGGQIRPGRLFRSGALELASQRDLEWLKRQAKLKTVLDVRHPSELDFAASVGMSSPWDGDVRAISLFPGDRPMEDLIAELNGLYGTGPSGARYVHYLEVGGPRFVEAFEVLTDPASYPVLLHCSAGKDRTGVIVAMVMEILGASDEDIADEYERSNAATPRLIAYLESTGRQLEGTREEIEQRLATPAERILAFLEGMRAKHGSAADYLLARGVPEQRLERLGEILVS